MLSDIAISNNCQLRNIKTIAKKYGIKDKDLFCYSKNMAKIDLNILSSLQTKKDGKLILVTSINPTPYGEGKTTMAIGLCDALNKLKQKTIVALREPSMGPVFGIKGGATGGGYAQVVPMDKINLHFTGDMHAITSANNLLCAIIDNHIYQGNALKFKEILIHRCLDVNDRALRNINIITANGERKDKFVITVSTEIMAILCLSKDFKDLKRRLGNIIVGKDIDNHDIYVKDLKATDCLAIILSDAINPNIVQTLEHNLAIIHGGPFANIAHGCNSIIATKMGLKLADYVVTEAGFGADLGAEKFLDITSKVGAFKPNVIVINVTIRSIKHNGYCPKEELEQLNLKYLEKGIGNLQAHIDNCLKYSQNILVCLNRFAMDKLEEINYVKEFCEQEQVLFEESDSYAKGSKGGIKVAQKVMELASKKNDYHPLYDNKLKIKDKIMKICQEIYHAKAVNFSEEAIRQIASLSPLVQNYPVCISKTQYSLSDNPKLLGSPQDYVINITKVYVNNGAEFVVAMTSNVITMPGLAQNSAYLKMTITDDKKMEGLF